MQPSRGPESAERDAGLKALLRAPASTMRAPSELSDELCRRTQGIVSRPRTRLSWRPLAAVAGAALAVAAALLLLYQPEEQAPALSDGAVTPEGAPEGLPTGSGDVEEAPKTHTTVAVPASGGTAAPAPFRQPRHEAHPPPKAPMPSPTYTQAAPLLPTELPVDVLYETVIASAQAGSTSPRPQPGPPCLPLGDGELMAAREAAREGEVRAAISHYEAAMMQAVRPELRTATVARADEVAAPEEALLP